MQTDHLNRWFESGSGLSDPGPPVIGTIRYYNEMADQNGGLRGARKFSRLYLIPNMGHCGGGPATDQFDLLSPLVAWVEHGYEPDEIVASGTNFTSAPTTRSRPLCPYPEEARYIGPPLPGGDLGPGIGRQRVERCARRV
jgi:feruloyl esterase